MNKCYKYIWVKVMDRLDIKKLVRNEIIKEFIDRYGNFYVPVAVSNRHMHISSADLEKLFGNGYKLKPVRSLSQPGQFVCEEKVGLVGPKGRIDGVRVLGPERNGTQVEISITDSHILGIKPVIRMSGQIDGTPGIRIVGPAGSLELPRGVIVSARHLHISREEAGWYGLKNGDVVKVRKTGERETVLGNVQVRAGDGHSLEVHIDTDEGNAAGIACGELLILEKY